MKKPIFVFLFVGTFVAYVAYIRFDSNITQDSTQQLHTATTTQPQTATATNTTTIQKYKNGTFTGEIADAYYGNVQVAAVIQNGVITDVQFLDYPKSQDNSIEINKRARPILKQETIRAQSAAVDAVSGATATSRAFVQSLRSALSQAQQ